MTVLILARSFIDIPLVTSFSEEIHHYPSHWSEERTFQLTHRLNFLVDSELHECQQQSHGLPSGLQFNA